MTDRKPLRLWPGVTAAVLLCVLRFVVPLVAPEVALYSFLGAIVCALAIVVWWLLFSRAPWSERVGAIVLMVVGLYATSYVVHVSIRTAMMGRMLPVYAIFVLPPALVLWAAVTSRLSDGVRRALLVATIVLACGAFTLLRTDGVKGMGSQLTWRWSKTAEERLLAQTVSEPVNPPLPAPAVASTPAPETPKAPLTTPTVNQPSADTATSKPVERPPVPAKAAAEPVAMPTVVKPAEWPGFRGPGATALFTVCRSIPTGTRRRPSRSGTGRSGPGGRRLRSAEICSTRRSSEARTRSCRATGSATASRCGVIETRCVSGSRTAAPAPRATPTLSGGRVYAFGATGLLNVLDASNGARVWSRDVASDADKKVPMWGFSSSPLVLGDLVVVAASGKLAAYDIATGKSRWFGPDRPASYSSPHRATIDGIDQILLLTAAGATSVAPADGAVLWEHSWPEGSTIVQPALTADGDVLINTLTGTGGLGIRRLNVAHGSGGWTVTERWTSTGLKPYFNDFVVHKGHAYGFDGSILSCIDLQDGKRKWKGGRFGDGQLVLLPDQDLLLVVSEEGDLALVKATPDQFTEVARLKAIEGKTWNHPVIVRDVLLLRNGEEMAAYRLPALAAR